jgi:polyisoprenoid-binding protein YceI
MKRFRSTAASLLTLSLLLFAAPVFAAPQTYEIDPSHSRVEFTIRHLFSRVSGSFGEFSGTIRYDAADLTGSAVNAEIAAKSIDTNNEKRDGHLRSPDFFDAAKYPTLTFTSRKVVPAGDGKFKIEGDLAIHGVTKPVTLEGSFLGAGPGLDGVTRAGFEATTKVDRKVFGILWNKTLDQGGTLLGDDVQINLEIEAVVPQAKAEAAKVEKAEAKPSSKAEKKEVAKSAKN